MASGVEFVVRSPIDDSIIFGRFQEPEVGITEFAVDSSLSAFESWSKTSVQDRVSCFEKALEIIRAQRYRLAALVLVSSGMTVAESVKEVDRLIEVIAAECSAVKNIRKPMGVWGIVASHNSPLASPAGYAAAAMLAGNTVVVMPSKYCPAPVYQFYEILAKASLPGGVFNLITDNKDKTALDLANDERLAGVVASGSGDLADSMQFIHVDDELRFVNEIKGMNPILISRPGDMKKVVKEVMASAFAHGGQSLFSTSKIIIMMQDQQKFMDVLIEEMKDMDVGDPAEPGTFMGPLISSASFSRFNKIVDESRDCLVFGGKRVMTEFTRGGYYVTPAIFAGLSEDNELSYLDSGLPVLCVKVVSDADEMFQELYDTECGLSAGIFSKDGELISRFADEADGRLLFINESNLSLGAAVFAKAERFAE